MQRFTISSELLLKNKTNKNKLFQKEVLTNDKENVIFYEYAAQRGLRAVFTDTVAGE